MTLLINFWMLSAVLTLIKQNIHPFFLSIDLLRFCVNFGYRLLSFRSSQGKKWNSFTLGLTGVVCGFIWNECIWNTNGVDAMFHLCKMYKIEIGFGGFVETSFAALMKMKSSSFIHSHQKWNHFSFPCFCHHCCLLFRSKFIDKSSILIFPEKCN